MKKFYFISISIFILCALVSCAEREKRQSLSDAFQNKIWFVDSTGNPNGNASLPGTVLKPVHDSVFDVYRDQSTTFKSFRIKGDTISIKGSFDLWKDFRGKQLSETRMVLSALDSSETHYLQNLTDLFLGNNSITVEKSLFYEELKNYTWYPIKKTHPFGEVLIDEPEPEEYLEQYSVNFTDTVPSSPHNLWSLDSAAYKFTDKALYVFNKKEKGLQAVFFYKRIDVNKFFVFDNMDWHRTTFKKIDPAMLTKLKN